MSGRDNYPSKKTSRLRDVQDGGSVASKQTRPPTPPPDRDRCPRGWDEDIWKLALLFESLADEQDIKLRAGRPVIYSELDHRIKNSGIRTMEVPFTAEEMTEAVNQELYPNPVLTGPQWRKFVSAMIYEFWSRFWDESATTTFTQKFMFIDMWDAVVRAVDPAVEN